MKLKLFFTEFLTKKDGTQQLLVTFFHELCIEYGGQRETLAYKVSYSRYRRGKLDPLKRNPSYFYVLGRGVNDEVSFRTLIQPC